MPVAWISEGTRTMFSPVLKGYFSVASVISHTFSPSQHLQKQNYSTNNPFFTISLPPISLTICTTSGSPAAPWHPNCFHGFPSTKQPIYGNKTAALNFANGHRVRKRLGCGATREGNSPTRGHRVEAHLKAAGAVRLIKRIVASNNDYIVCNILLN